MEDYKKNVKKALVMVKKNLSECEKRFGPNFEHTKRLAKRI
jgi:hypothetical protein